MVGNGENILSFVKGPGYAVAIGISDNKKGISFNAGAYSQIKKLI